MKPLVDGFKPVAINQLQARLARDPRPALERYWAERLAGQGTITNAKPNLGQKLENVVGGALRSAGVENHHANQLANRTVGALNDVTPVGNVTGIDEGARELKHGITRGDLKQAALGAGVFGLSMLPFAGPAKRGGGKILENLLRDEAGAIRAWHGSPHDFDRFDMGMIGTGEGNQAYGRGLYFADRPGVASSYVQPRGVEPLPVAPEIKDRLKKVLRAEDYLGFDTLGEAIHAVRSNPIDFHRAWEVGDPRAVKEALNAYDAVRWPQGKRPRLYEVNIDADPLDFINHDTTKNAEKVARERGAPGIRYLDGNSRAGGAGSSNYVVFDPSLIDILGKY